MKKNIPVVNESNIDIKKLRSDLEKNIGCDGLTKDHLKLSDTNLIIQFVFVYGVSSLILYAKDIKNERFIN